jgi:murein DD-endopeptidase MepM/ murein hydrolase activator NlpD
MDIAQLHDVGSADRRGLLRLIGGGLILGFTGMPSIAEATVPNAVRLRIAEAVLGKGCSYGSIYLDSNYTGYSKPVPISGRGVVYIRHTGVDFDQDPGTAIRAAKSGTVTSVRGDPVRDPFNAAVFVAQSGTSKVWVYGHVQSLVRVGQKVSAGQVIARIANPRGRFRAHLHLGCLRSNYTAARSTSLGWGRAYGSSQSVALGNALTYTYNPEQAFTT